MVLTQEEKQDLMDIIEIIYGYDSQIQGYKHQFKGATVEVVENAIQALIECNDRMKELVTSLVGGTKLMANGWLKKVLSSFKQSLENEKIKFNGLGCRNITAARWRSEIIISTY